MARRLPIGIRIVLGVVGLGVGVMGALQVYRGVNEMRGAGATTPAAPEPANLAQLKQAGETLQREVQQAAASHTAPPTLGDPAAAPRIRAAFDRQLIAGVPSASASSWIDACQAASNAELSYLNFAAGTPPSQAVRAENVRRFEGEITMGAEFTFDCMSHLLSAVQGEVGNDPNEGQRNGLAQMRSGVAGMLTGVVAVQDNTLSETNLMRILTAAERNGEVMSRALDPAHRTQVTTAIDNGLQTPNVSERVRTALQHIRTQMARTDCTGLCSL